ncbi:GNAT family N-acetyltransferase [Myxococcaceae bacterium GXIMD 01537]
MAHGLCLRPARDSERRILWRIHTRAVRELCHGAYSPREVRTWVALLRPEGYLRPDQPRTVLVAERGRRLVGFGQLDEAAAELEALYVLPEEVGQGIGTTLLAALEALMWRSGAQALRLDASLNAESFYRERGYVTLHAAERIITPDVRLACVRMEKPRPATGGRPPSPRACSAR